MDEQELLHRRQTLKYLAGAGLVALVGCGASDNGGSAGASTSSSSSSSSTSSGGGGSIPEETAGPYPADGSNGVNVLTQNGVVRSDIRSSFGSASGTAAGVPLTVDLTITDSETGDPIPGTAVYLWHCDREGRYSMYSQGVANENYLRGVQEAGDDGKVSFVSIFPACYSGRWPHIHFEVYPSLDEATSAGTPLATSQLAFPAEVCEAVYATDGYDQSVTNMGRVSLGSDNVFSDGSDEQLATVTGSTSAGYAAQLPVPV